MDVFQLSQSFCVFFVGVTRCSVVVLGRVPLSSMFLILSAHGLL